ncbi:TRAP transporter substrate-binding protein DctP [Jannaschia sp. LMIT008]|uniref:TRAP transporter substrate-binding protein DctP n=1 Tax=Jannaschia maritima TaxID=3032585 RepID=UPI0028119097|nr:TRAP transporter substrate-binding protein DctP [Jannaschia sp. LMIT008]
MFKTIVLAATASAIALPALAEEWDVSLWGKRRAFTEHVEKLAELVSEKTGGEFTLNISYGGLSGERENLDGISIGAFEMAQFCAGYHPDKNPSLTVLELPFLGVETLEEEREISQAVYASDAVRDDLARWNATALMPSPLPQYNLVGKGAVPSSLADLSGLSVRATGGIGDAMAELGATPTSMSATEVRQAMDSGVVQAVSFAPHAHMSFGTADAADWWTTNLNPGTVNCPVVVNTDALNGLSDAHREALLGSVDEALDYYVQYYNDETMAAWGPLLQENGIAEVSFDPDNLADLKARVAEPAAAAWVEENSARGIDAQGLLDMVQTMAAEQ